MKPRVVLDTNVLVAGLRSRRGASFQVLTALERQRFDIVISAPLVLEYEAALQEHQPETVFSRDEITSFVDSLCAVAQHQEIFYLWRPTLRDPSDDMVLEVAVAGGCNAIVTFNERDFQAADRFGIAILTPASFLQMIGGSA